jgi:hypothetical protein
MARRKLVTCRQGAFEEGNAGEVLIVLHNRFSNPYSPDRFGLTSLIWFLPLAEQRGIRPCRFQIKCSVIASTPMAGP